MSLEGPKVTLYKCNVILSVNYSNKFVYIFVSNFTHGKRHCFGIYYAIFNFIPIRKHGGSSVEYSASILTGYLPPRSSDM